MFYRLDGSDYLFVDWEHLDACLRPTDRDAGGRLCGKRARAAAGKVQAGSDKARKLAADIRASRGMKSVGESNQSSAARNAARQAKQAAIRSKVLGLKPKAAAVPDFEEVGPSDGKGSAKRKAAGEKSARTKARKNAEVDYLANNPAARKAVEKRLNKQGNSKLSERLRSAQAKQKIEGELEWSDIRGAKPKRRR